MDLPRSKMD